MKEYLYHINDESKSIYYMTPKCATRSILKILKIQKGAFFKKVDEKHSHYFSWGFVRNPFERITSAYQNKIVDNHQKGLNEYRHLKSFKDFIKAIEKDELIDRHIKPQSDLLPDDISFIGKLENMDQDLNFVLNKIGIEYNNKTPKINSSKCKHYSEYYDDETLNIVSRMYSNDIQKFSYKFDEK